MDVEFWRVVFYFFIVPLAVVLGIGLGVGICWLVVIIAANILDWLGIDWY